MYFREIHPDLAANGKIDHALIQFFDGAPSYDIVRERILAIAERSDAGQTLLRHK